MAATRLADAIVPEVFFPYMQKVTKEKSALFQSGILRQDANIASKLAGGGKTFQVPFWNDLDNTESGIANDDPASIGVPGKIVAAKDTALRQVRTRGWTTARLVSELAGDDPMKAIANRVSDYWIRQFQRVMISTLSGVFDDNIANDSSDMVLDITGATPTDANRISANSILRAAHTMGDARDSLVAIAMHSKQMLALQEQNLIDFIPDARGEVKFPSYLGYRVIEDDGCRVTGTGATAKYWTYLLGSDSIGWAEHAVAKPAEVKEDADQGNGMGVDTLWTRRQYVLHPYGIKWTDTTVTGEFPTNAELATAGNWNRVYPERKQIALAALVTNL